jgi:hypothetical protein
LISLQANMGHDTLYSTTNSTAYKKLQRYAIEKLFAKCSYCKPHSGENERKYQRSWKLFRKHQSKEIRANMVLK